MENETAGVTPRVLGIDPAPKKPAAIWSEDGLSRVPPAELREYLEEQLSRSSGLLVVWDSPLAFDPSEGFSDRAFDRAARAWVSAKVREGLIEPKAVSVLPFSGCPHWALSCQVLGLPFGEGIAGLAAYSRADQGPEPGKGVVVEIHPAVALAACWIDRRIGEPFPRYKGRGAGRQAPARIAAKLGLPEEAGQDDDALDAFMAYRLGSHLLTGEAVVFGDDLGGGYLLPADGCATEIDGLRGSPKRRSESP